jgi:hypothetical protein
VSQGGALRAHTAVVCSVLDQAVAALTNIAVLLVVARIGDAQAFAVFAMVYVVFSVLLGTEGAYVGQELVLHQGERARTASRSAVVFTAAASGAAGLTGAAVLALVPGPTAAGLAALGLVLPVVLTQDTTRYCFAVLGLPHLALAADTVRAAAALPALAVQPDGTGAARLVAVWGLSALPALALSALLLRRHVRGGRADLRPYLSRGHLGRRFVVEFAVGNATSQLAVLCLGLFSTPLAVGALRGATTLFGPLNVLFNSASSFGPPLLGRLRGGAGSTVRATAALAAVLAAVAAGWGAALYALPARAGRELLGDTWASAADVLPATGAQYAVMALGVCGLLTLRMLSPRATLRVQVVFSFAAVACMLAGYALGGATGAAWGLAAGSALKAGAAWSRVVPAASAPPAPAPKTPTGAT